MLLWLFTLNSQRIESSAVQSRESGQAARHQVCIQQLEVVVGDLHDGPQLHHQLHQALLSQLFVFLLTPRFVGLLQVVSKDFVHIESISQSVFHKCRLVLACAWTNVRLVETLICPFFHIGVLNNFLFLLPSLICWRCLDCARTPC